MTVKAKLTLNGKLFENVSVLNPGFMFGRTLLAIVTPDGMSPSMCIVEESSIEFARQIVLSCINPGVRENTNVKISILTGVEANHFDNGLPVTSLPDPYPCVYVDDSGNQWEPRAYWYNHPYQQAPRMSRGTRGPAKRAHERMLALQKAGGQAPRIAKSP